jgi:hypothetical protein
LLATAGLNEGKKPPGISVRGQIQIVFDAGWTVGLAFVQIKLQSVASEAQSGSKSGSSSAIALDLPWHWWRFLSLPFPRQSANLSPNLQFARTYPRPVHEARFTGMKTRTNAPGKGHAWAISIGTISSLIALSSAPAVQPRIGQMNSSGSIARFQEQVAPRAIQSGRLNTGATAQASSQQRDQTGVRGQANGATSLSTLQARSSAEQRHFSKEVAAGTITSSQAAHIQQHETRINAIIARDQKKGGLTSKQTKQLDQDMLRAKEKIEKGKTRTPAPGS